ncbi:MAG: cyclic nucleotide-binding domain-containing protein [Verrucomicrobia bacterium]|nr:cyclic nucleotide-binding domain-containing protein [Verrucomicrobiota bacterium]
MKEHSAYNFFKKNSLFSHLSEKSLEALVKVAQEFSMKKEEYLMREGDEAAEIFFVIEGDLAIIKYDAETKTDFLINTLRAGDTLGEQALIDKGKRSASVKAATDARLFRLSFAALENLRAENRDFDQVYGEISRRMSKKLRETTDVAALALKNELQEYKNRVSMGTFLVYVITVISMFVYTVRPLKYALTHVEDTTWISIPLILVLTLFAVLIIRALPFPLSVFGFTMLNWKKSLFEGFFFTIPVLLFFAFAKWLGILFLPAYEGHKVFEPFALMPGATFGYWLLNSLVYCLFVPIQEIMARGALQGPMEKFLAGKSRVWTSIIISNLIFSSAHVFLSEQIALLVLIAGIFFGWLYSRTPNLIGVIVSHCMVGVWGLNVVGPSF